MDTWSACTTHAISTGRAKASIRRHVSRGGTMSSCAAAITATGVGSPARAASERKGWRRSRHLSLRPSVAAGRHARLGAAHATLAQPEAGGVQMLHAAFAVLVATRGPRLLDS